MSSGLWTPDGVNKGRRHPMARYDERDASAAALPIGESGVRVFIDTTSGCSIIIGQHPKTQRWHLSIAHRDRYPSWDEIADARYALIPDAAVMVMILPPRAEYVNVHENCFHLHEVPEAEAAAAL